MNGRFIARRAFTVIEAMTGLALLGIIATVMMAVNTGYNRLARSLSDQRAAVRHAEAALSAAQAHEPVPEALHAKVKPLPTTAPAGSHWVSVEAVEKKRSAVLVGLVKGGNMKSLHRAGFTMMELMIALSLVAVGLTISTQMVGSLIRTMNQLTAARRETAAADEAVHRLRVDLERSATLSVSNGTVALAGVNWTADSTGLQRMAGDRVEHFDLPTERPQLRQSATGVVVQLGDSEWMLPSAALLTEGTR